MDAFLELPPDRQRVYYEEGQQRIGLAPVSIEKDFWVCLTLRELFNLPEWGERLTFKGGTSLSKCWQLIARFSEDIDMVIDREFLGFGGDTLSRKQQKKLVKKCSEHIQKEFQPLLVSRLRSMLPGGSTWELVLADETEDPDQQTSLFEYPTVFGGDMAYVRRVVKIELGARSETEPVETTHIRPYLAEAFSDLLQDSTFSLKTVSARRTFWEKAMLLHEETFRPADKTRRARLSRHYYDLWCLIRAGIAEEAMADKDLFDRIARHRQIFFRQSWVDYDTLQKGTLRVVPVPEQLGEWRRDYEAMREEMFFDKPPAFDDMLVLIQQFEEEFNCS